MNISENQSKINLFFSLLSLIGFNVVLAVMFIHMKWKVCPTCAIMDECHAFKPKMMKNTEN